MFQLQVSPFAVSSCPAVSHTPLAASGLPSTASVPLHIPFSNTNADSLRAAVQGKPNLGLERESQACLRAPRGTTQPNFRADPDACGYTSRLSR